MTLILITKEKTVDNKKYKCNIQTKIKATIARIIKIVK